jgi:hypothetical protein
MIQILRNGSTDISGSVKGISSIEYLTNDDLTFELPEITIQSVLDSAEVGDTITIYETAPRACTFYIERITYDYRSQLYTWRCPHILTKLRKIKTRDVSILWSDISPSYAQYNNQTSSGQGQSRWARRYWQVLFLMQVLIRKATGLGVEDIDVTVGTKDSPFYTRAQNEFSEWVTTVRDYATLGVSLSSLLRLGSQTHLDYQATDFDTVLGLPNCLQLLRWLCAASGLTIDIFRADYQILELDMSAAPTNDATKWRQDGYIEPYRSYRANGKRLTAGSFDYIYGTYDVSDVFQPYTYGTDDADYELTEDDAQLTNSGIDEQRDLGMAWPNLWKLYFVNDQSDYQSNIYYIDDADDEKGWIEQWLDMLYAYWSEVSRFRRYEIILPGVYHRHRSVELDIESLKMRYEVLT